MIFTILTVNVMVRLMVSVAGLGVGRALRVFQCQSKVQAVLESFVFGIVWRRCLRLLPISSD